MKLFAKTLLCAGTLTLAIAFPTTATAQGDEVIEEIVVIGAGAAGLANSSEHVLTHLLAANVACATYVNNACNVIAE